MLGPLSNVRQERGGRRGGEQRCNHRVDVVVGTRGTTDYPRGGTGQAGGRVQAERGAFQVGNSPRRFIARNLHPASPADRRRLHTVGRPPADATVVADACPRRERKCSGCSDTGAGARVERLMIVLYTGVASNARAAKIERFSCCSPCLDISGCFLQNIYIIMILFT